MVKWDYDEIWNQGKFDGMGDYWDDLLKRVFKPSRFWCGYVTEGSGISFKSYEKDDDHYLSSNVPGLKRDELSVKVKDRLLTVKAETKKESKSPTKYSFTKQYELPDSIKVSDTNPEAKLEDGVLLIKFKGFYKEIEPPEKKEFEIPIK